MQNKFLDLTNLQILTPDGATTTHYKSIDFAGADVSNTGLFTLLKTIGGPLNDWFKIVRPNNEDWSAVVAPQTFKFSLDNVTGLVDEDDEVRFFTTCVNLITSEFFHLNTIYRPREREYRLDVPAQLIPHLNIAHNFIKHAVNYRCYFDCFNIEVNMGDLHYSLVGGVE